MVQYMRRYALLDPNRLGSITHEHALAVDVRHLEVGNFGDTQTVAVGHAEGGLVFDTGCRLQELQDLFLAEHGWKLLRLPHHGEVPAHLWSVERHPEEEPQRSDRAVDGRRLRAFLTLVYLKTA